MFGTVAARAARAQGGKAIAAHLSRGGVLSPFRAQVKIAAATASTARAYSAGFSALVTSEGMLGLVKDIVNVPDMARKIGSWTVDENESVYTATRFMVDRRTGCLCVTREGKVVGILTERDYLTSVLHAGRRSETTSVKEIATMDGDLIVAQPEDYLQDCIDLMVYEGIRHLPIQEGGEVVALLGMEDVAKALAEERNVTLHSLHDLRTQIRMPLHDG